MAFAGGLLGADSDDYNRIADGIKAPDKNAYSNSLTGSTVQNIGGVANSYGALNRANVGSGGLGAQQTALGAITKMAAGQGPSLARANMQSSLNTTFNNLSNQAMSNQGNVGAGNSQRNLLNAQANAANNVSNQAGVASVAEQMGALQQQNAAAQALTQGQLAQGQFQQANLAGQQGAYQAQFGTQQTEVGNQMQYQDALRAQQVAQAAYRDKAANANSQILQNGIGVLSNVAQGVGAVMTGGASTMATGALGAAGKLASGGGGGNPGQLPPDYVQSQMAARANNSFNNAYNPYQRSY